VQAVFAETPLSWLFERLPCPQPEREYKSVVARLAFLSPVKTWPQVISANLKKIYSPQREINKESISNLKKVTPDHADFVQWQKPCFASRPLLWATGRVPHQTTFFSLISKRRVTQYQSNSTRQLKHDNGSLITGETPWPRGPLHVGKRILNCDVFHGVEKNDLCAPLTRLACAQFPVWCKSGTGKVILRKAFSMWSQDFDIDQCFLTGVAHP